MLKYKITFNDEISGVKNLGNNISWFNVITDDYTKYKELPDDLKNNYNFIFHAIYSCLTKVNYDKDRLEAYRELSSFLHYISENTGIHMKIIKESNMYYTVVRKDKPKVLRKLYKKYKEAA